MNKYYIYIPRFHGNLTKLYPVNWYDICIYIFDWFNRCLISLILTDVLFELMYFSM
jgi:hypothetical protein